MGIIIAARSTVLSNILKQHLKGFHLSHLIQPQLFRQNASCGQIDVELSSSSRPIELIETQTGKNVIHLVQTEPVELIILDWELSDQSGLSLYHLVKSTAYSPPILVMTRDIENRYETLASQGIQDILIRPYVRSDFQKKVCKLLQKQSFSTVGNPGQNKTNGLNSDWTDLDIQIAPTCDVEEIIYTVPRQQAKVSGDSFKIVDRS